MIVLIVRAVPPNIRGALSKWMIEPAPGVFVGDVSARIRDRLWEDLETDASTGSATLIYNDATEAGYTIRTYGVADRRMIELDGLQLIARKFLRYRTLTTDEEE